MESTPRSEGGCGVGAVLRKEGPALKVVAKVQGPPQQPVRCMAKERERSFPRGRSHLSWLMFSGVVRSGNYYRPL